MAKIQPLRDLENNLIAPVTHERAVYDSIGENLGAKLKRFSASIDTVEESLDSFEEITPGGAFIGSTTPHKWNTSQIVDPSTYGMLLDVTAYRGEQITINLVSGYAFRYAFLRSNNFEPGTVADFCADESLYVVSANAARTYTKIVPSDCQYLYVTIHLSGADVTPTVVHDEKIQLETSAQTAFGAINELKGRLDKNLVSVTVQLVAGQFDLVAGGLNSRISQDNTFFRNFTSNPYKLNGGKIVEIAGVESDENLEILAYTNDYEYLGHYSSPSLIPSDAEYVSFMLSRDSNYSFSERSLVAFFRGDVTRSHLLTPSGTPRFHTYEVSRQSDVNPQDQNYSGGNRIYNQGYVILPPNYSRDGEKVPLAFFIHGTAGYEFNEREIINYGDLLKFVAKNGYAVADCSSMSNEYSRTTAVDGTLRTGYRDTNYPCRLSVDCYTSLYKFLTDKYNIDPERVYVWGKSSGGRIALVLATNRLLPIKAVGVLNGSVDSLCDFRVLGKSSLESVQKMMEDDLGFVNVPSSFAYGMRKGANSVPEVLQQYLLDNRDKMAGFNPIFQGASGIDWDVYERAQFACSLAPADIRTSMLDNETLMTCVNNSFKANTTPTKIWAAVDDENVPYPMAVIYTKMVKRGGGICELRTIPAGYGKHWAVDTAPNDETTDSAPKVDYVTTFGETINITVAYAELVDWFNRWK